MVSRPVTAVSRRSLPRGDRDLFFASDDNFGTQQTTRLAAFAYLERT